MPKSLKTSGIIVGVLIVLFIIGNISISLLAEYKWMDSLGFGAIFSTLFSTKIALFGLGFIIYSTAMFITLIGIGRVYKKAISLERLPTPLRKGKLYIWLCVGVATLFGIIGSSVVQGLGWEPFLTYFNQVPFGVTEPIFAQDVAFYVFTLPFWNFVVNTLFSLMLIIIVIQALAFSVFQLYLRNRSAKIQMSVSVLLFAVLLAIRHFLSRYDTLLTDSINVLLQKSVLYGASYTDTLITIPWASVMAIVSIVAAIILLTGLFKKNIRWLLAAPILYVGLMVIGIASSMVVQQFVVQPNEFNREEVYLEHNKDYTRAAYGLDNIEENDHPAEFTLSADMIERNALTINNVRINDPRPLLSVYNSRQTIRSYYEFKDIDVDRYMIDGEYQQVFIGARELNTDDLPSQAQTWYQQTLRYTHGYGAGISHVNKVTSQGAPEYIVRDLPPRGAIEITRPQIYFGEHDYHTVIVNTDEDEFDYPMDEGNATYRFSENTGIFMSRFNRFLYAWDELSHRIFISGEINADSQLLRKRNVRDRLQSIAPFLTYDADPYLVVRDDGTMVWIVDAYTSTSQYPYSEPVAGGINYIENPVKAVVDAYSGEVNLYVVQPDDPMIQTYQNIFPTLLETNIPADIEAHFRYPLNLFKVQADILRTYHMDDLQTFFSREDVWNTPTERYYSSDIEMEPYYTTMQLPGSDREEFILMLPYTPNNRQNMIAWLAARNDGENYGELILQRFPKQINVDGPQQVENRINQDPFISQQLSLWDQGGSRVIRGNLMVIPIEDTILYVEPIYIESSNETALPEVQRIIVAYDDHIVMENNFETAIERLLEIVEIGLPVDDITTDFDEPLSATAEELINELSVLFNRYQNALSQGNWEEAGQIMSNLESKLEEWEVQHQEDTQEDAQEEVDGEPVDEVENGDT